MFAFAGEVNWPEDREITSVKMMENEKERVCPELTNHPEVSSREQNNSRARDWGGGRPNSAVNDVRTRILLDTGANVSVISANYVKRLRLREVPDHGRSLE
ncbi:Hypothetical protein PHPALM_5049, partial [Phytophthora palmivora]